MPIKWLTTPFLVANDSHPMNAPSPSVPTSARHGYLWKRWARTCCPALGFALCLLLGVVTTSFAVDHAAPAEQGDTPVATTKSSLKKPAESPVTGTTAQIGKDIATDIKSALKDKLIDKKNLSLVIKDKPAVRMSPAKAIGHNEPSDATVPAVAHAAAAHEPAVVNPHGSVYNRADRRRAAAREFLPLAAPEHPVAADQGAHGGAVHWTYEGETGPQAWGKLKPEFNICAIGKRQSPINIEESSTLQGPAEPLQFNYQASSGSVINNGHTIQIDLYGNNTLAVRGSVYKLVQFHFHTPSEEQVNYRNSAMVAHLVHKNAQDQLAVVAVLLEPGLANAVIEKVWTYMPLDIGDQVRLPAEILDMNDLLPKDQRYYQFIGSLTTPPCTEGVLWMVFKQTVQISHEQLKLFQQLYPRNARPVQPMNGRPVRNAQ